MPSQNKISRRDFLWMTSTAAAGTIIACAVNPVTGKRQFMLLTMEDEINIDTTHGPHQFSSDYGEVQDTALNQYISDVGSRMTSLTHRPEMPYSFRVVNANYVNAYAFPGGTIAATRGIMLTLRNEAELAALLGHELGHVNARHTSDRMSKQMLLGTAVFLGGAIVSSKDETAGLIVQGLGTIGQSLLLAHYSREDEHQADKLGMEYMVKAGYDPDGMVELMDILKSLSNHRSSAIEKMFASHPMSDERYTIAQNRATTRYPDQTELKMLRERYMDNTKSLRRMKDVIETLQAGEAAMAGEKFSEAENLIKKALRKAPRDYSALMLMSQCLLRQENFSEAVRFARLGKQAYPTEPQSRLVQGLAQLSQDKYDYALRAFKEYESMLPGNPGIIFYQGFSHEKMQHKNLAAREYQRFLTQVTEGEQAVYANQKLIDWGYIQDPDVSESGQ
ncbi:M48 family metalloprotease [bacterium]|nr:M48 family metalloprotease [bacterium]